MIARLKIELADRLRYSTAAQRANGLVRLAQAKVTASQSDRLHLLGDAYRILVGAGKPQWVEPSVRQYVEDPGKASLWRDQRIGWSRYKIDVNNPVVTKGIVLKAPVSERERGVMLLSFEYNWPPLVLTRHRDELLGRYTIICSVSWSPTHFQTYWSLAHLPGANVQFMIANRADVATFQRLRTGTGVIPLHGCDWINPEDYQPRPRDQREIDILMIANWATFKRHWVLFKALRRIDRKLRIVLVGQPESGRTLDDVAREAELYGVRDRVKFVNSLPIDEVTALQCNSRVQLVLSRREGYCNCVAESFFADTPVGLVKGTHMGPAAYINDATGMFLDERHFAADLCRLLDTADQFHARDWAMRNISCYESTKRMNALLKEQALARGDAWTQDIAVLGWRPDPRYVRAEDARRLAPIYRQLAEHHGLIFKSHSPQ